MLKSETPRRRNRNIVERLIRRDEDRGDFDRRFWQSQSVEERFAAAWDMVVEAELFRGNHAVESRLQRSVEIIGKTQLLKAKKAAGRPAGYHPPGSAGF
ncbi:MAG: hypothetical protein KJ964_03675 [Verrucomicrobia bacterium]|nr:hypothetical protein [Verrucomicrobiota bacterium]MBU1734916.1 hypothetical protein [Verrucomicrobiota bacterium]MBU1857710.1 hypothetical protein [Verrucomicrobiota bacterium]